MSLLSFIDLLDFYRTLAQPDGAAAANVYQTDLSAGYFCNFGCKKISTQISATHIFRLKYTASQK